MWFAQKRKIESLRVSQKAIKTKLSNPTSLQEFCLFWFKTEHALLFGFGYDTILLLSQNMNSSYKCVSGLTNWSNWDWLSFFCCHKKYANPNEKMNFLYNFLLEPINNHLLFLLCMFYLDVLNNTFPFFLNYIQRIVSDK